jgi:CBS domain-containing protein
MYDLNYLFQPVGRYCRRNVATCHPQERLVDAASQMSEQRISSLVVCEAGKPVGIITDRDLRNKVVAKGIDPNQLTVATIMTSPLITIGEQEFLFEALHRISRHGIHRIVVTGNGCGLIGIITDSDILRLQANSPQGLVRRIEEAATVAALRELHQEVQRLVTHLIGTGVPIQELVRLIAHLNDQILVRLIEILRSGPFQGMTDRFAFLVLGSEGRGEQTLTTDQDNALVYADDLTPAEIQQLIAFSEELIRSIIEIGIPPCSGGIMANNAVWRMPLAGWKQTLDSWVATPTPEHILKVGMVADLRALSGDHQLEQQLRSHITGCLKQNETYMAHMLSNLLRFRVPLGWFGRIKTETGEYKGQLDLKKAGIFSITEGVKLLALYEGIQGGGTAERLHWLVEAKVLDHREEDDLLAAFRALIYFRLRSQVEALREGRTPDNRVAHDRLNTMEQARLQVALERVRSFQELLQLKFRLGQLI